MHSQIGQDVRSTRDKTPEVRGESYDSTFRLRGWPSPPACPMKAPAFDYVRPSTLDEAVAALSKAAASGVDAQCLAGGQSLLAMMNLRVSSPSLLVDIGRLPELRDVRDEGDTARLGACVTHSAIEDGRVPDPSRGLMPKVAGSFSYRAVRTRGTLGGSLVLSDPAGDWVTVMRALDAQIVLVGPAGSRAVPATEFTTGIYETVREPDEILESVAVRKLSEQARWGVSKFSRKTGEFAASLAAVVVDPDRGYARAVLGGVQGAPIVLARASESLKDGGAALDDVRRAAEQDLRDCEHDFDDYQRGLHTEIIARAVSQALT